jgi:ATP-dependent RNA helicase RhlB
MPSFKIRTMPAAAQVYSDLRFADLDLPESLRQSITQAGFERCTPIQAQTLPLALAGHDVAGQAQTGTGKTAAYLIAMYNRLLLSGGRPRQAGQPRGIVLAPTRELAIQIHRDAQLLSAHHHVDLTLIYGGTDYVKQREQLKGDVDVLIGTPGRIIDYFHQHVFDLRAIEVMVLDEADRMFDLGFIKDIRFLLRRMPKPDKRLSMLFSATLSYRVLELAYEHMNNPQLIKIETDRITAAGVRQLVYCPANNEKLSLLLGLFKRHQPERTIIFVNTKYTGDRLATVLSAAGYKLALLSGDVPQQKRQRLMAGFQTGEYPILVATDVASRGLHIPDVSHVINYDLPQSEEDYVHRIGRTARLGAEGDAISFVCEDYAFHLPQIESYIGHKIPTAAVDPELLSEVVPETAARHRRRSGPGRPHSGERPRRGPVKSGRR